VIDAATNLCGRPTREFIALDAGQVCRGGTDRSPPVPPVTRAPRIPVTTGRARVKLPGTPYALQIVPEFGGHTEISSDETNVSRTSAKS